LIAYRPDGTQIVYNLGDIAWVIAAMALVWIMIPGVGLFYSGLLRRKNALSMIWTSLASIAVVSFQVRFLFLSFTFSLMFRSSGFSGGIHWRSVRQETPSLAILVSLDPSTLVC
jgi:Amt family ammonium transporter